MPDLHPPYALFVGDETDPSMAKTATGLWQWQPDLCVAAVGAGASTCLPGLPVMGLAEAREAGARTLVLGVAPVGGRIPASWLPILVEALELGMDLANGLHDRLEDQPRLRSLAQEHRCTLHDLRVPPADIPVGDGAAREGRRILTVGSDCAVGKMFTALSLVAALRDRGCKARFCATGQTGILIAGTGVPLDAVPADFIAGAIEQLCPASEGDEIQVIEGQGSLFHPGYAAVTLGLVHGAQAQDLVLCHEVGRSQMIGSAGYPVPELEACVVAYEREAQRTAPGARVRAIALNTRLLGPEDARSCVAATGHRLGLCCADPLRDGGSALLPGLGFRSC